MPNYEAAQAALNAAAIMHSTDVGPWDSDDVLQTASEFLEWLHQNS